MQPPVPHPYADGLDEMTGRLCSDPVHGWPPPEPAAPDDGSAEWDAAEWDPQSDAHWEPSS